MPSSPVKSTAAAKSPRAWPKRDEASIFGVTISSSCNGHATIWRGLCRALSRGGTRIVFFSATSLIILRIGSLRITGWAARALSKLGNSTVPSRAATSGCRYHPRRSCPRVIRSQPLTVAIMTRNDGAPLVVRIESIQSASEVQ
jgi:hypothetical protein